MTRCCAFAAARWRRHNKAKNKAQHPRRRFGRRRPEEGEGTHMWGFWKGGPAVLSVNLVMGLMGGFAKFSFRALRLPAERGDGHVTAPTRRRAGAMRRDDGTKAKLDKRPSEAMQHPQQHTEQQVSRSKGQKVRRSAGRTSTPQPALIL